MKSKVLKKTLYVTLYYIGRCVLKPRHTDEKLMQKEGETGKSTCPQRLKIDHKNYYGEYHTPQPTSNRVLSRRN